MSIIKKIYKKIIPAGSSFQFLLWKYRHLIDKSFSKGELNDADLNHPHRLKLVSIIKESQDFDNVLEIGCGKGTNIFLFAKHFPDVVYKGIDINKNNVKYANSYAAKNSFPNITFEWGNIKHLSGIADKSFDILVCDAVLIYVDANLIKTVASEFKRIAKNKIILVEFNDDQTNSNGYEHNKCWVRNYEKLFENCDVKMSEIEKGTWTEQWEHYGRFVEISLN